MKKRKIELGQKLSLRKETVTALDSVRGGDPAGSAGCQSIFQCNGGSQNNNTNCIPEVKPTFAVACGPGAATQPVNYCNFVNSKIASACHATCGDACVPGITVAQ